MHTYTNKQLCFRSHICLYQHIVHLCWHHPLYYGHWLNLQYLISVFPHIKLQLINTAAAIYQETNFFINYMQNLWGAVEWQSRRIMWKFSKVGSVGLQCEKQHHKDKWTWSAKVLLHCVVSAPYQICSSPLSSSILMDCSCCHLFLHFDTHFELWLKSEIAKNWCRISASSWERT